MKKVTKSDWFEEGFKILETEGFSKITIDKLCERLQVTKGSFYHHFGNMDGYVAALMDYWLEANTLSIVRKIDSVKEPNAKKKWLNKMVLDRSLKLEQIIRAWGYSNALVRKQVQKVDEIRLDCLVKIQVQEGKPRIKANDNAKFAYAALIGLQELFPDMPKKEKARLQQICTNNF